MVRMDMFDIFFYNSTGAFCDWLKALSNIIITYYM